MKRILVILLASLMLFSFVACDDNTPTPPASEEPDTPTVDPDTPVDPDIPSVSITGKTEVNEETVAAVTEFLTTFNSKLAEIQVAAGDDGNVTNEELKAVDGLDAYTKIGTVSGDLNSVELFGKSFDAEAEALIDINKNYFYRDKVWVLDEQDNLYVNTFYLFYSYAIGEPMTVNGSVSVYDFDGFETSSVDTHAKWADGAENSSVKADPENSENGWEVGKEFNVVVGVTNKPMYSYYEGQTGDDLVLSYVEYKRASEDEPYSVKFAMLGASAAGENANNVNYFYSWNAAGTLPENASARQVTLTRVILKSDGAAITAPVVFNVSPYQDSSAQ